MFSLNLPTYPFKIKLLPDGKKQIFDRIRRRFVSLTPEEFVRQNFVEFLIQEKKYPSSLIANEAGIEFNGLRKRCDTLVYRKDGSVGLIVEYKAPSVAITQKVFDQMAVYNMRLNVNKFIISNGLTHYCGTIDKENATYRFLPEIPAYEKL